VVPLSLRSVVRLGLAGIALATAVASQAAFRVAPPTGDTAPLVPDAKSARVASLGFEGLVADFFWLRAVQIVGNDDPAALKRALGQIGSLSELVVGLDPWVDHPYRFAALWISEDPDQLDTANRILERGVAYHPTDWRDRFYLSFNHFFFRGDNAAAARELEPAVRLPNAPIFLSRLLARLRSTTEKDGLGVAAGYLEEIRNSTNDPFKRAELEKALDEIATERAARFLDDARETYKRRAGRDIARVDDLVRGRDAVLPTLPAEPHGWEWELDPKTNAIVSSFYKHRYQLNFQDGKTRGAPATAAVGGDGR
jgi:hypothetical protein